MPSAVLVLSVWFLASNCSSHVFICFGFLFLACKFCEVLSAGSLVQSNKKKKPQAPEVWLAFSSIGPLQKKSLVLNFQVVSLPII